MFPLRVREKQKRHSGFLLKIFRGRCCIGICGFGKLAHTLAILVFLTFMGQIPVVEVVSDQPKNISKKVVIFYSHDYGMPYQRLVDEAIRKTFSKNNQIPTELFTECTGLSQISAADFQKKLLEIYKDKYSTQNANLVIAGAPWF